VLLRESQERDALKLAFANLVREAVMVLSIEVSKEQLAALKAKAAAEGLTLQDWLRKLAAEDSESNQPMTPFKSGYGILAKYGTAPSAEEIDENRREMFRGFAKDF
jgi:hypothetical protein